MKYQIRKTESITSYRATIVVELDDEKFRKLEDNPYNGNSSEEFMAYLSFMDFQDPPYDLDDKTAQLLKDIAESEFEEYANSCENRSDVWLQIGEIDEEYRKSGGFRVDDEIESNY
jgi:transposase-like protein